MDFGVNSQGELKLEIARIIKFRTEFESNLK